MLNSIMPGLLILSLASCGSSDDSARLVLGSGNSIYEVDGGLQYQLPFTVQVTDGSGNGIGNAKVDLSYMTINYYKGRYQLVDIDVPADGEVDRWAALPPTTCAAEDVNQNDVAEAGEDLDGDGILEPTNSATFTPHPELTPTIINGNTLLVDENGIGYFTLTYPKTEASWVSLRIRATTDVSGSEHQELFELTLPTSLEDAEAITEPPPSGQYDSRYGTTTSCTNPM